MGTHSTKITLAPALILSQASGNPLQNIRQEHLHSCNPLHIPLFWVYLLILPGRKVHFKSRGKNWSKSDKNIIAKHWITDAHYWLCTIFEKNIYTIKSSIRIKIDENDAAHHHHGVHIAVIMNSQIMTRTKNVKDERADSSPPSDCFPKYKK